MRTSQRSISRARRKAVAANRRLARLEAGTAPGEATGVPPAAPPVRPARGRRRLLVRGAVALVVVGLVSAATVLLVVDRTAEHEGETATVERGEVRGVGVAVIVRDGSIAVSDLALVTEIADLVRADGATVTVDAPLVVAQGGRLVVEDVEVRLRSDAQAVRNLEVRGGELIVRRATVTSWDPGTQRPDTVTADGRSSVLVTEAGRGELVGARLVSLGDEQTDRHGFSFVGGGVVGRVSDSDVIDPHAGITISGNVDVTIDEVDIASAHVAGVEVAGASNVRVRRSTMRDGAGDGIVVRGGSFDVELRDNDTFANAGSGIAVLGSSGRVVVDGNLVHRNQRAGVTVSNTRSVTVSANRVWDNQVGVSMIGGNSGAVVRRNEIGGNRGAGVESASAGNSATIVDNVIDHNEQGVVVADGTVEVVGNVIEHNTWGVAVLDKSPRATVRDNTIRDSADGAIRFVKADGVTIAGNTLRDNRMAPFIVDHADDSLPYHAQNDFDVGRKGAEWVYEQLRSIAELADITPVPAEFFSQPNIEFLLPVAQGGLR